MKVRRYKLCFIHFLGVFWEAVCDGGPLASPEIGGKVNLSKGTIFLIPSAGGSGTTETSQPGGENGPSSSGITNGSSFSLSSRQCLSPPQLLEVLEQLRSNTLVDAAPIVKVLPGTMSFPCKYGGPKMVA